MFLFLAQAPVTPAPTPPVDLDHWQTMEAGPTFEAEGSLIRIRGHQRGWTRTAEIYLDGVLRLKFRLASPDADGAVVVSAMVTSPATEADRSAPPVRGYRIGLHGAADKAEPTGTVQAISTNVKTRPLPSAAPTSDMAWHDLEVRRIRDRVVVLIDGTSVADLEGREPEAGYIGLVHDAGTLEFKDISIAEIPVPHAEPSAEAKDTAKRIGQNGVSAPTVITSEKPAYSIGAMTRHVEGETTLEVVIDATGHVIAERIVQSLDRELDLSAVGAARHWRFKPATQDGTAISIIVTLEMAFHLH